MSGFKSFGAKTVIELEPGITAIVGPNGSGKSNVADAIRWAMGEQSRSRLRLGERSEVVFAGSDGRARASMAEVSLVFDNSDAQLPIEGSEVELSRRLYRSGESEYSLMGRPVKLTELQLLLAQGRVGAGTYAVVGQGMIDSLIMGTPAERKELFDEAAGIRADELKREGSLRQLARTQVNMTRLHDIEAELADRLKSFERYAATGKRIEADTIELEELQHRLAATFTHELELEARLLNERAAALKEQATADAGALTTAEKRRQRHEQASQKAAKLKAELQAKIAHLEAAATERLAERLQHEAQATRREELEGELTAVQEIVTTLTEQLTKTAQKRRAMVGELEGLKAALTRSEAQLKRLARPVNEAQTALVALRRDQEDGSQRQYIDHALSTLKLVAQNLLVETPPLEQVRLLVHKTGRLLSHAARTAGPDVVAELEAAQTKLEQAMSGRESVSEHIANLTMSLRSHELELSHHDEMVEARQRELDRHRSMLEKLETELKRSRAAVQALSTANESDDKLRAKLDKLKAQRIELDRAEGGSEERVAIALELERATRAQETHARELTVHRERQADHNDRRRAYTKRLSSLKVVAVTTHRADDTVTALERQIELVTSRLRVEREAYAASTSEETELRARRDELTTQLEDLETAEANLRTVIERLDSAITATFEENFGRIAERFSTYFGELFEGGTASLSLETDNDNHYGIEIKASAKGKRLTSLAALSGGERALTGVALLAAIVDAGANPFIVLDEVDAALDEANSGKFAAILASLASRTQLIVVTHNRQTMTVAPTLYGVTLGKGHTSSLLSLRLEQAQSLAAR